MEFDSELARANLFALWLELHEKHKMPRKYEWHRQLMYWNYWIGRANGKPTS